MPPYECIEGQKISPVINQLISQKTLIKVSLVHPAFESLSVVTRTEGVGSKSIFEIDPPDGLLRAIAASNAKSIHIEFNSEDRVSHHFNSEIVFASPDQVRLSFPKIIERHQQRDNFRVKVFCDAYAKLVIDKIELRMPIDNVSLGGVFCLCPNIHKSKFSKYHRLNNMELFLPLDKECYTVSIQQVRVLRFERKPLPKHFGIAFEFARIKRNAKKLLVQQIYELQRFYLKNRLKFQD